MLFKCELMLLKCQINTNTKKQGFLHPTKCLEWVLKYSYLVTIIFNYRFPKCLRNTLRTLLTCEQGTGADCML